MPPIIKAMTQVQFSSSQPKAMKKPTLADSAMANSLVSTVPITFLADIPFLDSKTGVAIGPHPPPPVASAKPAISPSGIACFRDKCKVCFCLFTSYWKRNRKKQINLKEVEIQQYKV